MKMCGMYSASRDRRGRALWLFLPESYLSPQLLYFGPRFGFLRTGICQYQQSAHDGHVLEEIDHLLLLLLRRTCPEMVEYQRYRNEPQCDHQRRVFRFVASEYQQAAPDFDQQRNDQ